MSVVWLFVPGHEERKVRKAFGVGADVVILDWEDGVPPEAKEAAREATRRILASARPAGRVVVRIHGAGTPEHAADLAALEGLAVDGVVLPKAEDPDAVTRLGEAVPLPLILLVESALGLERAFELARAHPRVERLAFGALDYLLDLGVAWSPDGEALLYARSRLVVAGRAAGRAPALDGVWPRLDDPDGLARDAALARRLGFGGKLVVHPRQIPVVRRAFAPTEEEVERARRILAAWAAREAGTGAIRVDGRLVDRPVVRWAEEVLARARSSEGEGAAPA